MKRKNEDEKLLSFVVDWLYKNRNVRKYDDFSCTLRINCGQLLVIEQINNDKK